MASCNPDLFKSNHCILRTFGFYFSFVYEYTYEYEYCICRHLAQQLTTIVCTVMAIVVMYKYKNNPELFDLKMFFYVIKIADSQHDLGLYNRGSRGTLF